MLNSLANLIEKLGALRGDQATAASGPENTSPCWPAPVRKPEAVVPKLVLAPRRAPGGSSMYLAAPGARGRGPESLVLRPTDATR